MTLTEIQLKTVKGEHQNSRNSLGAKKIAPFRIPGF